MNFWQHGRPSSSSGENMLTTDNAPDQTLYSGSGHLMYHIRIIASCILCQTPRRPFTPFVNPVPAAGSPLIAWVDTG